jgi:hypothetical protein
MSDQTETRLPWGNDTITIKGRNAGIEHLTVFFDDEHLNIIDYLNHSLMAEYAALYETIMSTYEAKLKSGSIFDHDFPETAFTGKKIDPSQLKAPLSTTDKELIDTFLAEYNTCLEYIKTYFREYEAHVEKWFDSLPEGEKKV